MSDILKKLEELPEISFIDNKTLEAVKDEMIDDYLEKLEELTGNNMELAPADPVRLILNAAALQIFQTYKSVDNAGKMSLLKYSRGDFLDNLAALKGVTRDPGTRSKVTMRFSASEIIDKDITIPSGTRTSTEDQIFFETEESGVIPAGEPYVDILSYCTEAGDKGDGYKTGEINILVDQIAYIASVANVDESRGGTEQESDDSLKEKIFTTPKSYSVAGPVEAYAHWTKESNAEIQDVDVRSESDAVVHVTITTERGTPTEEEINDTKDYLRNRGIRPLTDKVEVSGPTEQEYEIDLTYYTDSADNNRKEMIDENIRKAVDEYIAWQKAKLGRDINPSRLIGDIMTTGAKRVEVRKPEHIAIDHITLAKCTSVNIIYGGAEDD